MFKINYYLILALTFTLRVFGSCGEESELATKIQHLKMEVACTNANSIHLCQQLMTQFHPISDEAMPIETLGGPKENTPQSCHENFATMYPISVTARTLANHVNKAVSIRPKLVNSVEEFFEHTRLHRARVKTLGLELLKTHPELFQGLKAATVGSILEAHDLAKVSASSLAPDGQPFYRTLYKEGYGKRLDRTTVDALNAKDKLFMEQTMTKFGLNDSPELQAKMERIEKIADLVDRGMSPVSAEEFGRPMDKASSFLKNEEDKKLALELEKNYNKIIPKLSYKGLTPLQQMSTSNHLLIEERFAASKAESDSTRLSARMMAHTLMSRGNSFFTRALDLLTHKGVTRALIIADVPLLYFADMNQLGCSGIGYHDWVKDPNCKPAIGLTPKIIKLINEDWPLQKFYLNNDAQTCDVIHKTYTQSITSPKIKTCGDTGIEMELAGGDRFKIKLDNKNRMTELELNDLSRYIGASFYGKAQRVAIGSNGRVEKICFEKDSRGRKEKKCLDSKNPLAAKTEEFLKIINYQIQKGIRCCRNDNPTLAKICPR